MKENPYVELLKTMTKEEMPEIRIGKVISNLPNLIIEIGDLQLSNNNLLLASNLYESGLNINDTVAVHRLVNNQLYLISMKVVRL